MTKFILTDEMIEDGDLFIETVRNYVLSELEKEYKKYMEKETKKEIRKVMYGTGKEEPVGILKL